VTRVPVRKDGSDHDEPPATAAPVFSQIWRSWGIWELFVAPQRLCGMCALKPETTATFNWDDGAHERFPATATGQRDGESRFIKRRIRATRRQSAGGTTTPQPLRESHNPGLQFPRPLGSLSRSTLRLVRLQQRMRRQQQLLFLGARFRQRFRISFCCAAQETAIHVPCHLQLDPPHVAPHVRRGSLAEDPDDKPHSHNLIECFRSDVTFGFRVNSVHWRAPQGSRGSGVHLS
jgi:hypothetical protein